MPKAAQAPQPGDAVHLHGAEDGHELGEPVVPPASTIRAFSGDTSFIPRAVSLLQDAMRAKGRSLRDIAAAWDCSHQLVHKVARGERSFTVAHVMALARRDPEFGLEVMRRLALELDDARRRVLVRALVEHGGGEVWAGNGTGV